MLFSHIVGRAKSPALVITARRRLAAAPSVSGWKPTTTTSITAPSAIRSFSSKLPPDDPQVVFTPVPPKSLNMEMALGIQNANNLIVLYGVGKQRLELLAQHPQNQEPLTIKWQKMMEIYLGAQFHNIAAMGYETNEDGIIMYSQHLAAFIEKANVETQEEFRAMGRKTWRSMLAMAFQLDEETVLPNGKEIGIVDARNISHKVASKLMEPQFLQAVTAQCAKLPPHDADPQVEMQMKHHIIQDLVIRQVYLGGSPSLVEECGFGSGDKGYATMQYIMGYHENDPLCSQYTSSAMIKIWQAAGLDLSGVPQAARLPMSSAPV